MKSITNPEVNIRMAVLDIMDVTGLNESEVLKSLSDRLADNHVISQGPLYLRYGDFYRLDLRDARAFLWCLIDEEFEWSQPIDGVIDDYNRRVKDSIPFEQFNFRLPDLRLLLDREGLLDFEKDGLLKKWQYGRLWNEGDIPGDIKRRRQLQIRAIVSAAESMSYDPKAIPDGGKAAIKAECLKDAGLFTNSGFEHAWKAAKKPPYECIQIENHERYSPRKI